MKKNKFEKANSIGIVGRGISNKIELDSDDSITIGNISQSIFLDSESGKVTVDAGSVDVITSNNSMYSAVNGEELVSILEWIIGVLKTHQHGPNSPAVPDFHSKANYILSNIESALLNKKVRHN